jgi:hypothetical protein
MREAGLWPLPEASSRPRECPWASRAGFWARFTTVLPRIPGWEPRYALFRLAALDADWQSALDDWMAVENLEERTAAPGWIDRRVLDFLRDKARSKA